MASKTPCSSGTGWRLGAFLVLSGALTTAVAQPTNHPVFAARAGAEFHRAQVRFESNTNDFAAAWGFARACFDLADFATNDTERATLAVQGIAASRQLLAQRPKSAPGHYYLGMNLGQLARTEILGALKIVREMEREFKTADDLDEQFDYAGPARCLGLLYRDAPGWPASIGSRRKAREWLERAAKLAPDYPENHLNLIESRLKWDDRAGAESELKTLDALWPKAQTNLAGAAWEPGWADWTARKSAASQSLAQTSPPAGRPRPVIDRRKFLWRHPRRQVTVHFDRTTRIDSKTWQKNFWRRSATRPCSCRHGWPIRNGPAPSRPVPRDSPPPWPAGCLPIRKVTCSNSAPAPARSHRRCSNAACARTGSWPSNGTRNWRSCSAAGFPARNIITGDAWRLDDLLREWHEPIERVGAVISSLPLLNFPPAEAEALAKKIRVILEHGGNWVQFSYNLGGRRPHGTSHFLKLASNIVWLNLPPARVNVYQK